MTRVSGPLILAALVAASMPCIVRAAPAEVQSASGDVRPAAGSTAMPASAAPGADVVPGTSSTIRLLLDLQTAQPSATSGEAQRPARSAAVGTRASGQSLRDAGASDLPDTETPSNANSENGPPPSVSWSTSPATAGDPGLAAPPRPELKPSVLRSMVAYLREHRLEVFVGGLAVLALAAIGTVVSTRRQRAGRRVTADRDRAPGSRPRRSGAVRSR